jgi:hypothetical protein
MFDFKCTNLSVSPLSLAINEMFERWMRSMQDSMKWSTSTYARVQKYRLDPMILTTERLTSALTRAPVRSGHHLHENERIIDMMQRAVWRKPTVRQSVSTSLAGQGDVGF